MGYEDNMYKSGNRTRQSYREDIYMIAYYNIIYGKGDFAAVDDLIKGWSRVCKFTKEDLEDIAALKRIKLERLGPVRLDDNWKQHDADMIRLKRSIRPRILQIRGTPREHTKARSIALQV